MSDDLKLSPRQRSMLRFIHERIEEESRPPTIREIGGALKITSTSVVNYNLNRLKEKGLLDREETISRGLKLTDSARDFLGVATTGAADVVNKLSAQVGNLVRIPMMGNIVAGSPIDVTNETFSAYDYYEDDQAVEISDSMLPRRRDDLFALRVDGFSMIDDMITDGDIVVLKYQETADDGDIVAVWVEGEGNTLKRFYRDPERNRVRLQPRNPGMDPIYVRDDEIKIQGKLVLTVSQAK